MGFLWWWWCQVVRHERASIKADIWSFGIIMWELFSGEDITEYQPLAISRQVGAAP
jgi:serine/threonine protein kinase